ncbi:hypothetical protein XPA_009145 [Xanthoria parietina]
MSVPPSTEMQTNRQGGYDRRYLDKRPFDTQHDMSKHPWKCGAESLSTQMYACKTEYPNSRKTSSTRCIRARQQPSSNININFNNTFGTTSSQGGAVVAHQNRALACWG